MKQSALTTEQQMVEAVSPMVVVPEARERGTMCGDLAITKRLVWGRHEQSTWQSSKLRFSQPGLRLYETPGTPAGANTPPISLAGLMRITLAVCQLLDINASSSNGFRLTPALYEKTQASERNMQAVGSSRQRVTWKLMECCIGNGLNLRYVRSYPSVRILSIYSECTLTNNRFRCRASDAGMRARSLN